MHMPIAKSQVARFGKYLTAALGAKGGAMLDLVQLVQPSVDLTSDRPDLLASREEFLWSSYDTVTAAAAQFPTVWLGTLDTAIMIIEQLVLQSSITQKVRASMSAAAIPVGAPVEFDDKRVKGARFAGRHASSSEAALSGANRFTFTLTANTPFVFPCKYIVAGVRPQGTPAHLIVQGETAGVTSDLFVSARGYGRVIEQSELAP